MFGFEFFLRVSIQSKELNVCIRTINAVVDTLGKWSFGVATMQRLVNIAK